MIIYKATNKINNKVYIGQSQHLLRVRKQDHKNQALIKNSTTPFHKAIRRYGWDNFSWEVIDKANTIEELNAHEYFYIEQIPSKKRYNLRPGGLNYIMPDEIKEKISKSLKGRKCGKFTEETRVKLSEGKIGNKNPQYGTKRTPEEIQALLAFSMEVCCKKVAKVNKKTNEIIQVYESISQCARDNSKSIGAISLIVNGKTKNPAGEYTYRHL